MNPRFRIVEQTRARTFGRVVDPKAPYLVLEGPGKNGRTPDGYGVRGRFATLGGATACLARLKQKQEPT